MSDLNVGVATHFHKHGADGYIFAYKGDKMPTDAQVVQTLGILYEESKGEVLTVATLSIPSAFADSGIDRHILKLVRT